MAKKSAVLDCPEASASEILRAFEIDERRLQAQREFYYRNIRTDPVEWSPETRQAMEKISNALGFNLAGDISDSLFIRANGDLAEGQSVDDSPLYQAETGRLNDMVAELRKLEEIANVEIPKLRGEVKVQNQKLIQLAGRFQKVRGIRDQKPFLIE